MKGHNAVVKVAWWSYIFRPKAYYAWCSICGRISSNSTDRIAALYHAGYHTDPKSNI